MVAFDLHAAVAHFNSAKSLSCVAVFHDLEDISIWLANAETAADTWTLYLDEGILVLISHPYRGVTSASPYSESFHGTG